MANNSPSVIIDTGSMVAALNRRDAYHTWVTPLLAKAPSPIFSCEAVISEACFLLYQRGLTPSGVLSMVTRGFIRIPFHLEEEKQVIEKMMLKYTNVPMSFADACLVRMTELYPKMVVLTLDHDFQIYRRFGRQTIPLWIPET